MAHALVEKLKHTEPAEKKMVALVLEREQLTNCQSRFCQKEKEQSRQFRAPDRKEGIRCQRSKESHSRGKRKRRVFLYKRTVRVKVKSKVIPTSFLKIEGRGTFVEVKGRRKRNS